MTRKHRELEAELQQMRLRIRHQEKLLQVHSRTADAQAWHLHSALSCSIALACTGFSMRTEGITRARQPKPVLHQ